MSKRDCSFICLPGRWACVILSLALLAAGQNGNAQFGIPAAGDKSAENTVGGGNLFGSDPDARKRTFALRQARTYIKAKSYTRAINLLQQLVDAKNDSLFPEDPEKQTRFLSHKSEAMRLLGTLPPAGKRVYELQYGLKARQLVEKALASGDFQWIEEAARRFFHTTAGYEATYLLASQELDRGQPLSAALHFERLMRVPDENVRRTFEPMLSLQTAVCWGRAGLPHLSVETLVNLKRFTGDNTLTVGGRKIRLFQRREEAISWLVTTLGGEPAFAELGKEQWTMFRGDPMRTARSAPASPVWDNQWNVDTVRGAHQDVLPLAHLWLPEDLKKLDKVAEEVENLSRLRLRQNKNSLMLPAMHPLIVGDVAVFRTLRNIWAVDARSGELLWQSILADNTYDQLAGLSSATSAGSSRPRPTVVPGRRTVNQIQLNPLQMFLDQRLWRDLTAGTLSSDGEFVFAVEGLDYYNPAQLYYNSRTRQATGMPASNYLVALNVRTGRLEWQRGGKEGGNDPLAGHFFLGPPLPLGDQLFCLADYRGEIRLIVLEQRKEQRNGQPRVTVEVLWTQSLVTPTEGVSRFPLRRMAGLTPSYAGGVLVCPTTGGAVVAVDPGRRQLLWGYRYPTNTAPDQTVGNPFMARQGRLAMNPYDAESRWLDAAVTLSGGHVLLTPRDSNELHCLSLLDGNLLWKRARGQMLYVAAVEDGKVVLAGLSQMQALRLADGRPAWKQPTPLPAPSGRGFQTDHYYHLPLETAEIATVDLRSGRVLARTKTRSGLVPGNLVSAHGMILSQTIGGIMGFKPLDELQQEIAQALRNNPRDPQALALRGEIRLRSGEEAAGLQDLRAAIATGSHSRAQTLVASVLMEGLRLDFATFRKYREELEQLLKTAEPDQRARYRRLLATGLHEVGEYRAAFSEYLKLAGLRTNSWKRERVSGVLTVRGDRWLQSRLVSLFNSASPADRRLLQQEIEEQFALAAKDANIDGLRRFVGAFGQLPVAYRARRILSERLRAGGRPLEREFLLEKLLESEEINDRAYATGALAQLFAAEGHFNLAAGLLSDLEGPYAGILCGNQTGRNLAASLRKKYPELAEAQTVSDVWPDRRLVASVERLPNRQPYRRMYPIPVEGTAGRYYRHWSFSLDSGSPNRELVARDGRGVVRWRLPTNTGRTGSYFTYYGNSIQMHGHLLVVVLVNRFLVIDGLSRTPRILWERNLFEVPFGQPVNRAVNVRGIVRVGGRVRFVMAGPNGFKLGTLGPLSSEMIVYQVGKTVYAADPLSGDVLWERRSVERGSRLFGNDEFVFIVTPGSTVAVVLRGSDGEELGVRPVASESARRFNTGRHEVSWETSGEKRLLTLRDIWNRKILWQKHFSRQAKMEIVEGDEAAVLEPVRGQFHVVSLKTGKTVVEAPIQPDPRLSYFLIRRSGKRYVLLTYSPAAGGNNVVRVQGINYYSPLVNGYAYGFDRQTGKKTWTAYVAHQSLDTAQPGNLPILVLAARRYETLNRRGVMQRRYKLGVTILDLRNGRLLFEYDSPESVSNYTITVDPVRKSIGVRFSQTNVLLKLTDQPLPPPNTEPAVPPPPMNKPSPNKAAKNAGKNNANAIPGRADSAPVPENTPARRKQGQQ